MTPWKTIMQAHALRIDHMALAVPDLDASVAHYRDRLGFALVDRRETRGARTGMRSAVMRLGDVTFVLIEGTEPASQVSRFVAEHGPGVQHVAIEVRDLDQVAAALGDAGVEFEVPMIESPFTRQLFTTRDAASGVRLELIERRGDGFDDRSIEALFRAMEAREAW